MPHRSAKSGSPGEGAHYRTGEHTPVDPGPMAPHFHTGQDGEEPHLHTHAHGQDPAHAGQSA
ncbi:MULTISPECIES: hypothetical protein [Streptomyces]|uniref:hypothetical protein n=1 Tax=Streptomyces TaxID=1883 RepID=UPI0015CF0F8B|nr:hypothetical protein [Streptomyces sp. wa1063]WTE30505.1 hypothetical protein OHB50_34990 [Streptomyces anulatus]